MDERLESMWLLVYYQVSGELGIARCSHRLDIYLGECGLARKLIHWSSPRNLFFACLIFAVGLDREIILTAKFSRSMWYFEAPKERRKSSKGFTSCSYPVTRHGIVANWS